MIEFVLTRNDYDKDNIALYGNMFNLGNGHLGYRGTLEEYKKEELVALNVVGFYDQYKDKWRESINLPNPFYFKVDGFNVLEKKPISHHLKLNFDKEEVVRNTTYDELLITSKKVVHQTIDNLLLMEYEIKANKDINLKIEFGLDDDIYEINGPHFKEKKFTYKKSQIIFDGKTNENKKIRTIYKCYLDNKLIDFEKNIKVLQTSLKENQTLNFKVIYKILENNYRNGQYIIDTLNADNFEYFYEKSIEEFKRKFDFSKIEIVGNDELYYHINYSIYHLLILGNANYLHSIPARGVSGQTYKGAIFWDTEIFLFPFFILENPEIARNLILYRINSLAGAKRKAKEFGYKGAFYAWESQEKGKEACSLYNVSDPITNEPIRTYFSEKQIHINFDVVKTIDDYVTKTGDFKILEGGGFDVISEVIKFLISRVTYNPEDDKYHINDVIGPDEYHERVDDNAFTNYMANLTLDIYFKYVGSYERYQTRDYLNARRIKNKLYLPEPNSRGIIEQFKGYFDLEDVSVEEVKERVKSSKEYLGGQNGVASKTRVIKQADVICLLALLPNLFSSDIVKANYDYYDKYTEHGSSLSASMYSLVASRIGYTDKAYEMLLKSAKTDLSKNQKLYAGGIYIGGTHPASNGGAYLSLIYGLCGARLEKDKYTFENKFNDVFESISFNFYENNKVKKVTINKEKVEICEVNL